MELEVERVLHMKGGVGETSYANNSLLQRKVIEHVKPMLEESVKDVCNRLLLPDQCLRVADLGCASGPNTLIVTSQIMQIATAVSRSLNRKPPSFQIFLNDLPSNDFNSIFSSLHNFFLRLKEDAGDEFGHCFISGTPGSFYTRLFPTHSLHFVHASYSLQYLSQVPEDLVRERDAIVNKGNIYISKSSGPEVEAAYHQQFEKDFSLFLRLRAQEIVHGGSMLITTMGSLECNNNPPPIYDLLSLTLQDMVLGGVIEEKKLDLFNMPYYAPAATEVEKVVEVEGSFVLRKLERFAMPWDARLGEAGQVDVSRRAAFIASYMRAVSEPLFSVHFGDQLVMDDLFARFKARVINSLLESGQKCEYINLVIYLTKKHSSQTRISEN